MRLFAGIISFASISLMHTTCFAQSKTAPSWYPDSSCAQEYERVGKDCTSQLREISTIQQCLQEKVRPECVNQMKNAQNQLKQIFPKCLEVNQTFLQKMASCNNSSKDPNLCLNKTRREFENKLHEACGGMQ
jgi:hypothetical protein